MYTLMEIWNAYVYIYMCNHIVQTCINATVLFIFHFSPLLHVFIYYFDLFASFSLVCYCSVALHLFPITPLSLFWCCFCFMLNQTGSHTAEDDAVRDVLYIAMAGTHQIWALYLKDSTWLKGGSVIHVHAQMCQLLIGFCIIFTFSINLP